MAVAPHNPLPTETWGSGTAAWHTQEVNQKLQRGSLLVGSHCSVHFLRSKKGILRSQERWE